MGIEKDQGEPRSWSVKFDEEGTTKEPGIEGFQNAKPLAHAISTPMPLQ